LYKIYQMKRVLIGTIIATVIFFGYQATMWMGGFHNDFCLYSGQQDTIMHSLNSAHLKDGLYMMPSCDPTVMKDHKQMEDAMKKNVGKPWAMIFYHTAMEDMQAGSMIKGIMHVFFACLFVCLVLYNGSFSSFGSRFMVSMAFSLFALVLGPMNEMNWWGFPWGFIKTSVIDLTLGWAICSIWLAYYVKKKMPIAQ